MPAPTRYHSYSNSELLQLLEDRRNYSPVVEELCQRIEQTQLECPICEADLYQTGKDFE